MSRAIFIRYLGLVGSGSNGSSGNPALYQNISNEASSIHRSIRSNVTQGTKRAGNNLSQLVMQSTYNTRHFRTLRDNSTKTLLDDPFPSRHHFNASVFSVSAIRYTEGRYERIRPHVGKLTHAQFQTHRIRSRGTAGNGNLTLLRPHFQTTTALKQQITSSTTTTTRYLSTTRSARHVSLLCS